MKLEQYITEAEQSDKKRWMSYLRTNKMLQAGVAVMNKLEKAGFTALIVGGSVRDIILGQEPHDIDISTSATPDQVEKVFGKVYDIGQSKDFGIVLVREKGHDFEVATFRKDGTYSDGRRPDSVEIVLDFKSDSSRRDLTMNAMGIDKDGNIIDHFNGRQAIKDKIIKTVGNPNDRFKEDALRMMRAVRFSAKMGFDIEKDTKDAIIKNKQRVKDLSPERIQQELMKMASQKGGKFADAIIMLDEVGILELILPDIVKLKGKTQNPFWHPEGDSWEHTIAALRANKLTDPLVNLSVLLHDIGKSQPSSYEPENGYHRFLDHEKKGVDLAIKVAKKLKLSTKDTNKILFSIANHMRVHRFPEMKTSKIVKLMQDENWATLFAVSQADTLSTGRPGEWEKTLKAIKKVEDKWGDLTAVKVLKVTDGKRVMSLTKLHPGPKVGQIIKSVTNDVINKGIKGQKEIDKLIMKYFEKL